MQLVPQLEPPPTAHQIGNGNAGRHAQTLPIENYWEWSAVAPRQECTRLAIYNGQLKAQMIKDLISGSGRQ